MSHTVSAANEEKVAYLNLQATGHQLPSHTDTEGTRQARRALVAEANKREQVKAEFTRRLRKLAANQAKGECLESGNALLWNILEKGLPWQRDILLSMVKRTVAKQLWRSLAGARSGTSSRNLLAKALSAAEEGLLSDEEKGIILDPEAKKARKLAIANDILDRKSVV